MNTQIDQLLDKYWEGESTQEEENIIREYFRSDHIASEHLPFLPLFQHFHVQKKITYTLPDPSFIISKAEQEAPVIFLHNYRKMILAAAAVFTLLLASWFVFKPASDVLTSESYVQEIEDPEEAYRVTMQALALVSGKLNKGTESIAIGMDNVNKANIFK